MLSTNHIAFKEWAVVCAALATGRQTILLRKGGLDEGRDGFRVKHAEFWLLPTRFHQAPSQIVPDALPLWEQMIGAQLGAAAGLPGSAAGACGPVVRDPAANCLSEKFQIELYAAVEEVFEIGDLAVLERLAGEHILSSETIQQRFHYRQPGLFVLSARIYRIPRPHELSDSPYIAGCKSWVDLSEPLSTTGSRPVLDDALFAQRFKQLKHLLSDTPPGGD